ncbi:hypothetical protein [Knoellia sp. p5-6-4]|nr:hypothetical protein [Knoellia sp. p5-6-4]MDF2145253.1 hypothetical protein [Knoellia sp. p5-6-4]
MLIEPVSWGQRPSRTGTVVNWAAWATGLLLTIAGHQTVERALRDR